LGQTQLDVAPADFMDASYFEPRILVVNMLIVLAFSFYIEVMKQISTQKARLDAEMSMAQRIQNDLLPVLEIDSDTFSLHGHTESATEVGGDYCDVIRLSDNRIAVAVGDVSGHNVAAGLTMAILKTAFRTELAYLTDIERMVASLNETVYDNVNRNMFISLLFGLIDPVKHELTLINCGHPPMLHYSAKDESIHRYRTGGPALGLQQKSLYQSEKVEYASGDIFVLLSDGLIETANASGEEFDCDQVSDLLRINAHQSPVELYNILIENAKAFRGQLPQRDDVTIVVLKMN
jgi:serine phosphatase RsbU (regulator of sigma subunit)